MAWTTPRTWTDAEVVTASLMNTHVRDNDNALYDYIARSAGILIQSQTLGSDAASVTFSSIPATYARLRIEYSLVYGSTGNQLYIQFNTDTGNNYYYSDNGSGAEAATDKIMLLELSTGTTTQSYGNLVIPSYANTATYKACLITGLYFTGGGVTDAAMRRAAGTWVSSAAISTITLLANTGNLKAGARFDLFGIL